MKNWIWRASVALFAAGLSGAIACGASSSGCGGTNLNSNSTPPVNNECGAGTMLNSSNQCVPVCGGGSTYNSSTGQCSSSSSAAATKTITQ